VLALGCTILSRAWRRDAGLRAATRQAVAAVRANMPIVLIAIATAVSAATLAIVALHLITG
jgi:hypothetical protein